MQTCSEGPQSFQHACPREEEGRQKACFKCWALMDKGAVGNTGRRKNLRCKQAAALWKLQHLAVVLSCVFWSFFQLKSAAAAAAGAAAAAALANSLSLTWVQGSASTGRPSRPHTWINLLTHTSLAHRSGPGHSVPSVTALRSVTVMSGSDCARRQPRS